MLTHSIQISLNNQFNDLFAGMHGCTYCCVHAIIMFRNNNNYNISFNSTETFERILKNPINKGVIWVSTLSQTWWIHNSGIRQWSAHASRRTSRYNFIDLNLLCQDNVECPSWMWHPLSQSGKFTISSRIWHRLQNKKK